jgi:myo-inositol catabolism protein IolS
VQYRQLGRSGITVSEIGFGAWAIGGDAWGPVEDRQSLEAIHRAIDLGVTFIDTADVYGDGRSERLVGQAIAGRRDRVVVSTKGGLMGHHRDPEGKPVYDRPQKVIDACDASLRRLGTDYIDVYWCHIWWHKPEETDAFLLAFEQLKTSGKVRAVGVSTDGIDHVRHFNRHGLIDAVQFDYSILNRNAEKDILPYAAEQHLGCVVRGPLHKGMLSGKFSADTSFRAGDLRERWPGEQWYPAALEKVQSLREIAGPAKPLTHVALQFVLAQPAVSVAIPGAKDATQVEQNVAASLHPPIGNDDLSAIEAAAPSE